MRRIGIEERRARLGRRHMLARPASDVREVVSGMFGLHSTDPATVFLSSWARKETFRIDELKAALYESRDLVRAHGMRRTLWVVTREALPVMCSSSTVGIAERERRRVARMLEEGDITNDGEAWMTEHGKTVIELLKRKGPTLTREINRELPPLAEKVTVTNRAGRVTGSFAAGSRLLTQLGFESEIVRADPVGSWTNSQYRWSTVEDWLGSSVESMPVDLARADLIKQWLSAFGPGTEVDISWWTGWTLTAVRKALADLEVVEVDLDGKTGFVLPGDEEDMSTEAPWIALLPALDPTPMGWKERDWYLGDLQPELFDRNGNVGPTIWADGRIVGGWGQSKDGRVSYEILVDVGGEALQAIAARASELQEWLGETVVTPRFRTPLEKRLVSS